MTPFWKKTTRHLLIVGISLGIVGHLFGRAFLIVQQMYSGGVTSPENDRVLWQTPLVMASIGLFLTFITDVVFTRLQKPVAVPVRSEK